MGLFDAMFGSSSNTQAVKNLIGEGAVVIDVRTPDEFRGGHVAGSKNIPLHTLENRVDEIKNMGRPVVLCCASGNRSGQAARFLKARGIECENGGGWTQVNALV